MSPSWLCRLTDTDDLCDLQNFISPMIMSAPTLPLSTSPDDFPPPAYQSPQKWVHSTLLEHIHIAGCGVCGCWDALMPLCYDYLCTCLRSMECLLCSCLQAALQHLCNAVQPTYTACMVCLDCMYGT